MVTDIELADAMTQVLATYPDEPLSEGRLWDLFLVESKIGKNYTDVYTSSVRTDIVTRFSVIFRTCQHLSEYIHPLYRHGTLYLMFSTNSRSDVTSHWREDSVWNTYFNKNADIWKNVTQPSDPWVTLRHILDHPHEYSNFSPCDKYNGPDPVIHYIIRHGKTDLLRLYLTNYNFEETLKNQDGLTPLEVAMNHSNVEIAQILLNAMRKKKDFQHEKELQELKDARMNAVTARNTAMSEVAQLRSSRVPTFLWGMFFGAVSELWLYMWWNDYF